MMKTAKIVIHLAISIMILGGCASKNESLETLEKELLSDKPVALYTVPSGGIYASDQWAYRNLFKSFPFITPMASFDFKGKLSPKFYDELTVTWKAVPLDQVDWAVLADQPSAYDIIYVQSVGIGEAGALDNDFMNNIAKAYKITPANMKRLKNWIETGGVLWCEAGLWGSRFETFYPYGGINDAKTIGLFSKEKGAIFGLPVNHRIIRSASVDMVNYETVPVLLKASESATQLKGVGKVLFTPSSFIESYPIIKGTPLLEDSKGTVYASYGTIGKGVVLTMVPTVYWHADDNGELFRWKLLSWVLERQNKSNRTLQTNL